MVTEKASQGRGLGTDALNCLVDFGFGELRLERIYLHVFDYNARAQRSYEKAGFQTDAILRRSRFHRGEHHDVHLMSILRGDWLAMDRRRAWDPPSEAAGAQGSNARVRRFGVLVSRRVDRGQFSAVHHNRLGGMVMARCSRWRHPARSRAWALQSVGADSSC